MKDSAVFMNIGRGTTVNEDDLAAALISKQLGGAVLDVYQKEPLESTHFLWNCPNLLMTPHCADQDLKFMYRSMEIFGKNLKNFVFEGVDALENVVDKKVGY